MAYKVYCCRHPAGAHLHVRPTLLQLLLKLVCHSIDVGLQHRELPFRQRKSFKGLSMSRSACSGSWQFALLRCCAGTSCLHSPWRFQTGGCFGPWRACSAHPPQLWPASEGHCVIALLCTDVYSTCEDLQLMSPHLFCSLAQLVLLTLHEVSDFLLANLQPDHIHKSVLHVLVTRVGQGCPAALPFLARSLCPVDIQKLGGTNSCVVQALHDLGVLLQRL